MAWISSPSLSDSPSTFKVDCNVVEAFLENRPKFKFLQNSSHFFFFHLSLSTRKSFKPESCSRWHSFVLDWTSGFKKKQGQRTKWKTKSSCRHSVGLWFVAILIYVNVISMNIINLTTQS